MSKFFFSSRRRHTRSLRDWSSDVCSSDLPHVFVSIDPSGLVTIIAHRAEMGTGSRTSLPMAVADELEADWSRVKVVQSPGDEKKYGNQNTDGSQIGRASCRERLQI